MIIIGSTALKYWFPYYPREPKDLDVIFEDGEDESHLRLSYNNIEKLKNPVLLEYYKGGSKYLPTNLLYTLKISHVIGWELENNSWDKHMWDIQYMRSRCCVIDMNLFYKLYDYWTEVHGANKRSDLEMTAENFFDNAINTNIDHDLLHTFLRETPTYKKILVGEVSVSMDKFEELSFEDKCNLVQEEVMVMAAERYKGLDFRFKYSRMLKKFIINHAPIPVGIFAITNFIHLIKPPYNFMKVLNNKLKENNLKELI